MSSVQDYTTRIRTALGGSDQLHISAKDVTEAKGQLARIRLMQKELRLIKKDVGLTIKNLKSTATTKKAEVGKGFGAGVFAGVFGKKAAGRMNTINRDAVRRQGQNDVAPFENVARRIDDLLLQLDKAKLQIDTYIAEQSAK